MKNKTSTYITIVRGWHDIFKLFRSENINGNKVALSMSMLTGL